jgi:hypothetical protein
MYFPEQSALLVRQSDKLIVCCFGSVGVIFACKDINNRHVGEGEYQCGRMAGLTRFCD